MYYDLFDISTDFKKNLQESINDYISGGNNNTYDINQKFDVFNCIPIIDEGETTKILVLCGDRREKLEKIEVEVTAIVNDEELIVFSKELTKFEVDLLFKSNIFEYKEIKYNIINKYVSFSDYSFVYKVECEEVK